MLQVGLRVYGARNRHRHVEAAAFSACPWLWYHRCILLVAFVTVNRHPSLLEEGMVAGKAQEIATSTINKCSSSLSIGLQRLILFSISVQRPCLRSRLL